MSKAPTVRQYSNSCSPEAVLRAAMELLECCRTQQCSLDEYLDSRISDPLMRRRLSNLAFTFFRRRRAVKRALDRCCSKAPEKKLADLLYAALTMAAFQQSLPPESVVNIAVALAKKEFGNFKSRFVNAVLRKALLNVDKTDCDLLPEGLAGRWKKQFSAGDFARLSALFVQAAPATVRLRDDFLLPAELADKLTALELDTPWKFFRTDEIGDLIASEFFRSGAMYIQDPAPAKVCALLEKAITQLPERGSFIDLCAAPGGKLIMNMELLKRYKKDYRAFAVDRSGKRLDLVRENLQRCQLECSVFAADAATFTPQSNMRFELVTCDVPCSNSGVFRHRPDALWRWSQQSMNDVVQLQKKILNNAAAMTAAGGLLLYSTCSLETGENSAMIADFVQRNADFTVIASELFLPDEYCDGTFAALLLRQKESER